MTSKKMCRLFLVIATSVLLLGCSAGAADPQDTAGDDLPFLDAYAYEEPLEGFGEVIDEATAVVYAELVEIQDELHVTNDREMRNEGVQEEIVGLHFELKRLFVGDIPEGVGERVVVEWNGYELDDRTSQRTARIRVNGVAFDEDLIGDEFLLAISETAFSPTYRLFSLDTLATVNPKTMSMRSLADTGHGLFGGHSPGAMDRLTDVDLQVDSLNATKSKQQPGLSLDG